MKIQKYSDGSVFKEIMQRRYKRIYQKMDIDGDE